MDKKTAVVTGGGRGIGFAIARQLGLDGFNIVIMDILEESQNEKNLQKLRDEGIEVVFFQGDIGSPQDRTNLVKTTVERYGAIDVLVNNAGVAPKVRADLLEMTEESFDYVVGLNTKGTMFLTQAVANQMLKQPMQGKKRGTIINISSCSAVVSSTNRGEYCISKAGVSMLTTLYADRLAGENIFVHEIRPGVIATEMTSKVQEKYDELIAQNVFPIARWGQPEDIAQAVSVFCQDCFLYTTGNYVDIDGGFHIKRL